MKNNFIKISFGILALCLFASCAALRGKIGLRENRPFQIKQFDAEQWRAADAQTRGEMSQDLRNDSLLSRKSRRQILELLGEPDRKTRGRCCGAGGTFEEEVWLYDLEVMQGSDLKTKHFQIYFHPSDATDDWRVAEWDASNPDYISRVG